MAVATSSLREKISADMDWKFFLGDPGEAQSVSFNDQGWTPIELPHDWSIEGKFDKEAPVGKDGGFLAQGLGWYRHTFVPSENWRGRKISVDFEGVYMNADIWINGKKLGSHPYGYTPFSFDLTSDLKFGEANVLAVKVDVSRQNNSRWYSGAGICRHAWFTVTGPTHLDLDNIFLSTREASAEKATVHLEIPIVGEKDKADALMVRVVFQDKAGQQAIRQDWSVQPDEVRRGKISRDLVVSHPLLWSPDHPQLYQVGIQLVRGGQAVDQVGFPFGIRFLAWSAAHGIQINGETVRLCGGSVHNDNGAIGAAAFDRAEHRKVEVLKNAGFNAVRTSHNPPTSEFLNACDQLGILVIDEAFDCWNTQKLKDDYHLYFADWWKRDLDAMLLRDRNHPSVIMWSIGNEIPERFDPVKGFDTTRMLTNEVRRLDSTRPITCAYNGIEEMNTPNADKIFQLLDVVGYNYNIHLHKAQHARIPDRMMVSTESQSQNLRGVLNAMENNPYVVGDFVWTALDYIGESGLGRWEINPTLNAKGRLISDNNVFPWHGSYSGDIDSTGFRKPISHYRNILWDRGEHLYAHVFMPIAENQTLVIDPWGQPPSSASWSWPGYEGQPMKVEVDARYDQVELFLNGQSQGKKSPGAFCKATFTVPYAAGILKIVGIKDGRVQEEQVLKTATASAKIRLTADRTVLSADSQDLSYVTVEITDANGVMNPNATDEIQFSVSGPAVIQGVDNGNMQSLEPYKGSKRQAFHGRALVIVRSLKQPGVVHLKAHAAGLADGEVLIQVQ